MAVYTFLLTRPLRDVTMANVGSGEGFKISTHTPLAGRDCWQELQKKNKSGFLLTRPLRDVTERWGYIETQFIKFLLTRPLRDVTL